MCFAAHVYLYLVSSSFPLQNQMSELSHASQIRAGARVVFARAKSQCAHAQIKGRVIFEKHLGIARSSADSRFYRLQFCLPARLAMSVQVGGVPYSARKTLDENRARGKKSRTAQRVVGTGWSPNVYFLHRSVTSNPIALQKTRCTLASRWQRLHDKEPRLVI